MAAKIDCRSACKCFMAIHIFFSLALGGGASAFVRGSIQHRPQSCQGSRVGIRRGTTDELLKCSPGHRPHFSKASGKFDRHTIVQQQIRCLPVR